MLRPTETRNIVMTYYSVILGLSSITQTTMITNTMKIRRGPGSTTAKFRSFLSLLIIIYDFPG